MRALPHASLHVCYEQGAEGSLPVDGLNAGWMDFSQVPLTEGAADYLRFSMPFLQAARSGLVDRGVPPQDIQYEFFGPDLWQADAK